MWTQRPGVALKSYWGPLITGIRAPLASRQSCISRQYINTSMEREKGTSSVGEMCAPEMGSISITWKIIKMQHLRPHPGPPEDDLACLRNPR